MLQSKENIAKVFKQKCLNNLIKLFDSVSNEQMLIWNFCTGELLQKIKIGIEIASLFGNLKKKFT